MSFNKKKFEESIKTTKIRFIYENIKRIKHLHQLQNLYFHLTFGEELIIEKI